jgi:hypothetical protein
MCSDIGGTCITERDGYFITTGLCLALGVISLVIFILPTARRLQGERSWVNVSLWQKLKFFLCSFAGNEVARLYMIQRYRSIYFIYHQYVVWWKAVNYCSVLQIPQSNVLCVRLKCLTELYARVDRGGARAWTYAVRGGV